MDKREKLIDFLLEQPFILRHEWLGTGSSYPSEASIRDEVGELADVLLTAGWAGRDGLTMSDATEAEVEGVAMVLRPEGHHVMCAWQVGEGCNCHFARVVPSARAAIAVRGTEVEWGIRGTDGDVHVLWDERAHAEEWLEPGDTLVSRTVGPWTVVDVGA